MNRHLENPSTVLIVNDDQMALDLLKDLLEPEHYKVFTASSARHALEITATLRMDIIICDVVMPEMDGMELCRILKRDRRTAATPVLMVSAIRKEEAALLEGFAAGADDYVEIPFRHEELLVKVARLVERYRVERRYREIVEQAVDIIYTRDMSGRITSINEAGTRFFGRPAFELIGQPLSVLIGEEAAASDIAELQKIKTFEPIRFTSYLKNALGELRYLEGLVSLERDSQGASLGVRGVVRDVTDQQTTENALRESEGRYRVVAETASDAIMTIDESTKILFANPAAEKIFGYSVSELFGSSLNRLIPEYSSHLIQLGEADSSTAQRQAECKAVNVPGRHRDGHEVPLEISFGQVFTDGKRVFTAVVRDVTERQRAEAALQKQNEEYRILFESNPCPMYVCAEDSLQFLAVNRAAVNHYGYSHEEFLSMTAMDIRPAEDVPALRAHIGQHPETHYEAGVWKHRKKDGSIIDVDVNWQKLDFAGRAAYMVMANDITEQKRAEIAMRESEERYRELFQNANDIIYTIDLAGNFTSLNQTGERLTGYTQAEALCMNIAQVVVPEQLGFVRENLARKIESDDASSVYETEIITKAGRQLPLELSSRLIYQQGKPVGVQGIARDISARKGAEEALKDSEEKFRSIVETTNEWIWAIDLEGQHIYTNPAIEQILGYKTEEILGANVLEFVHPEDSDELAGLLQQSIEKKRGWNGLVLRWKHKHGGFRHLESNGLPVFDPQGTLIGYRGADRDITQRKLAEEALSQQAERAALTNRISQAVRRTLDVSEVFHTAVRELGVHLEVDRCSLFMKDEQAGRVTNAAEYHVSDVAPAGSDFDMPQVQGLNAAMEKHGVLAFDDVANDERIRQLNHGFLRLDVKSIMYVGVTVGNELLGAFALSTTRGVRHWSEADIEVAKAAADQTGIAIRQARLYQKAAATSMREALVNKLGVAIRASLSLTSVLDTATRELGQALSASRVEVRLYDATGDQSFAKGEYVASGCESVNDFDAKYDELLRNHFITSANPLVIRDTQQYAEGTPEFANCIRLRTACTGARSQIDYPLTVNDEFRGVISIHQTDSIRGWTEDEVALVESVASQLATGIAQAELFEMVARAKKEWESTFDAMSDGIFIFDQSGKLVRVNRAGAAMDRSRPESMLGHQCCDILRTSSDGAACIVEQALRQSESINLEIVPQHLDRPVLVTVEPVLDERGLTVGAVCTARDLSELRKVEAVARERQSLLKNIMESAQEAIYALDKEGNYKWCNHAMLEMTGYELDAIIGHHFLERTHEDDREMRAERFAEALLGRAQSFESRYIARDGSVRFASVNSAPIVVDGETTGVLGIAHDITEQKQERDRAARADKLRALGQLASGVAHDFNNSLAAILGRAQLILRRVEDEELIRSLGIIVTAAEDAAATVRRIQTFARKSVATELELLEVGGLLRDAIEITRTRWQNEARAEGSNVEVTLDAAEGLMTLGNASELREVFVNLIVNAVDAMPQGGSLTICCNRNGNRMRLRFADTGTGMKEDVRERVFEPFYTTKGVHGTGLGLAVSYGIIERHQGLISVESKLGRGTTFYIDLPYAEATEVVAEEIPVENHTPSLSVLVVDDEPFVRETLAEMLLDLDHRVVTVEGGREALQKVSSGDFDLVFTDLAMPEMDGWETARAIRKERPELPVVLVTGYGATAQPPSGELDLVAGIIGKPFDFDQVTGTIARVCKGRTGRLEDSATNFTLSQTAQEGYKADHDNGSLSQS
jgi:PAS domain S-box-containing protein